MLRIGRDVLRIGQAKGWRGEGVWVDALEWVDELQLDDDARTCGLVGRGSRRASLRALDAARANRTVRLERDFDGLWRADRRAAAIDGAGVVLILRRIHGRHGLQADSRELAGLPRPLPAPPARHGADYPDWTEVVRW